MFNIKRNEYFKYFDKVACRSYAICYYSIVASKLFAKNMFTYLSCLAAQTQIHVTSAQAERLMRYFHQDVYGQVR